MRQGGSAGARCLGASTESTRSCPSRVRDPESEGDGRGSGRRSEPNQPDRAEVTGGESAVPGVLSVRARGAPGRNAAGTATGWRAKPESLPTRAEARMGCCTRDPRPPLGGTGHRAPRARPARTDSAHALCIHRPALARDRALTPQPPRARLTEYLGARRPLLGARGRRGPGTHQTRRRRRPGAQ